MAKMEPVNVEPKSIKSVDEELKPIYSVTDEPKPIKSVTDEPKPIKSVNEEPNPNESLTESNTKKANKENNLTSTTAEIKNDMMKKNKYNTREIFGIIDFIYVNHINGAIHCILCDWPISGGVQDHTPSEHHQRILELQTNWFDSKMKERSTTSNLSPENGTELNEIGYENRCDIIKSLIDFQKNTVHIDLISQTVNCKKCTKTLDFDFNSIKKHIEEHNLKETSEFKESYLQPNTTIIHSNLNNPNNDTTLLTNHTKEEIAHHVSKKNRKKEKKDKKKQKHIEQRGEQKQKNEHTTTHKQNEHKNELKAVQKQFECKTEQKQNDQRSEEKKNEAENVQKQNEHKSEQEQNDPKTGQKESKCKIEQKQNEPKTSQKQGKCKTEWKRNEPKTTHKQNEHKNELKAVQKQFECKTEQKQNDQKSEEKQNEAENVQKQNEHKGEQEQNDPKTGQKQSKCKIEQKQNEPKPNQKQSKCKTEQKQIEPKTTQKQNESEQKHNEPKTGQKQNKYKTKKKQNKSKTKLKQNEYQTITTEQKPNEITDHSQNEKKEIKNNTQELDKNEAVGTEEEEKRMLAKDNHIIFCNSSQGSYCNICKIDIPNYLSNIKQHVFGNRHRRTVAQDLKEEEKPPKVLAPKPKYKTVRMKDYLRFVTTVKNFYREDVVINESICIDMYSFTMCIMVNRRNLCQACEVTFDPDAMSEHRKSSRHMNASNRTPVVVMEGEFIREIRHGIFHCGFCNKLVTGWEMLESHLKSQAHKEWKRIGEWQLIEHTAAIKRSKLPRELITYEFFEKAMAHVDLKK